MQLMDLDEDCQYLVFDKLRVTDLNALARTNKYYESFAMDIVRRRFAKKMVIFDLLWVHSTSNDYTETNEYIEIEHAEAAIKMLIQFGRFIKNLKIQHVSTVSHLDREPTKKVYRLIQEHCSESLTQFHFKHNEFNYFDYVTKPFKNVQNVTLNGNMNHLGNNQLNLQQIFPAMRYLHVNLLRIKNMSTLTLEFPHLEHLNVAICTVNFNEYVREPTIVELIRKNPQIRSIVLGNLYLNLLEVVSETLVNLEQLTLYSYFEPVAGVEYHFEQVKSFKFSNNWGQSMPSNITFGEHLEEFEVNARLHDHKYIDFIENNRNLKKICIHKPDNDDIQRLAAAELNVTEISISFDNDVEGENLVQLVKNCKQLNQLHLKMTSANQKIEEIFSMLRKEFENRFISNMYKNEIFLTNIFIF